MMKRFAQIVRHFIPTDVNAMLMEISFASEMERDRIGTHVILIIVNKLVAVR